MLVPRSYKYASSPPREASFDEKYANTATGIMGMTGFGLANKRPAAVCKRPSHPNIRPDPPSRTVTEPAKSSTIATPTRPVDVPIPDRGQLSQQKQQQKRHTKNMPTPPTSKPASTCRKTSFPTTHKSDSLPPSVAALLAVTEIPRPRPHQFRRRPVQQRRISIDELVNEWKTDSSLKPSYGSSPSLSVLLEDASDIEDDPLPQSSASDDGYMHSRTRSSESMPGLDADNSSITSANGPSTPGSLRSRKSATNLRKEKQRSLPSSVDQSHDHPLLPTRSLAQQDDENNSDNDALTFFSPTTSQTSTPKPKTSFKSNLTASLHSLTNRAISSISSFTLGSSHPSQTQLSPSSPWSNEVLWSHPFLFPRFSSEVRPAIQGTPTEAQRRYLNPATSVPLVFEEQEAPFQQALHAPYLAEQLQSIELAPKIQMQTYNRQGVARKKGVRRGSSQNLQSEAGRALQGQVGSGVRQRELRENSDFLRVVVLEMNMRREGKLEMGRAKIWLPPRSEVVTASPLTSAGGRNGSVPKRWQGISAA